MAGWASSQNWCQQFLYRIQKQNSNSSNQAQHSTLLAKRCCKMICCLSSTWHWREATLRCRSESFFVQHSSLLHITDDVVIFVCDASLDLSVHPVQSVRLLLVILLVHFSPRLNLLGVSTSFIFIFIPCLAQWFTDYYSAKVAKLWIVRDPSRQLPHGLRLQHLKQALKGNPSALQGCYKIAPKNKGKQHARHGGITLKLRTVSDWSTLQSFNVYRISVGGPWFSELQQNQWEALCCPAQRQGGFPIWYSQSVIHPETLMI